MNQKKFLSLLSLALCVVLNGCSNTPSSVSDDDTLSKSERREDKLGKMFGEGLIFGGDDSKDKQSGSGIAVNYYLWRAALDTVSFMPLRSVDPFGGVIITEWYMPPESPNERFKVDVVILDRQLRADGVRVSMHRQQVDKQGLWKDQFIDPKSFVEFEEAILTRARQLKMSSASG